jgi:hypothetical protein
MQLHTHPYSLWGSPMGYLLVTRSYHGLWGLPNPYKEEEVQILPIAHSEQGILGLYYWSFQHVG